jgi:2-oxoglutarate ferredoxin oxidoreductase subunit alpha
MNFTIKIGAQAGQGVNVIGKSLAKCFSRGGLNVISYPEYPSLVRGGHNIIQVMVSDGDIHCPIKESDLVIALNQDAVFYHKEFITKNGAIIYDSKIDAKKFKPRSDIRLYPMPVSKIVEKAGGSPKMANSALLAAALCLVNYPIEYLEGVLTDEFKRKGDAVVKKNISVARAGFRYAKENLNDFQHKVKPVSKKRKMLLSGNEAVALGAVAGGMKFYSAYPMTPASNILHYLMANERKFNIVVKQTEDEIAAMNYTIGANFAGVRAMTGTSGGGFALMTEALGMAALSETPVVASLVSRIGPSTGMPTWTEQADLRFALHASQGDFLRVILAPGDMDECFYLSAEAFNLADKYQLPVIIMSDKFLAETMFSTEPFDQSKIKIDHGKIASKLPKLPPNTRFKRYENTKDGISPRVIPGTPNGLHVATSYEHDETGFSSEDFENRTAQVDKRHRKLKTLNRELPGPKTYGDKTADISLVAWGSHKLPALDALNILKKKGIKANLIHFTYLFPLNQKEVKKAFSKSKHTIMIENNSTAQFAGVLKEHADQEFDFHLLKYDGRQFFSNEISNEVEKLVKSKFKGDKTITVVDKDYEYYNPQRYGL